MLIYYVACELNIYFSTINRLQKLVRLKSHLRPALQTAAEITDLHNQGISLQSETIPGKLYVHCPYQGMNLTVVRHHERLECAVPHI